MFIYFELEIWNNYFFLSLSSFINYHKLNNFDSFISVWITDTKSKFEFGEWRNSYVNTRTT